MPATGMRCLFVNWKDGSSSQFTVPDDYRLPNELRRRRKPKTLTILDLDANAEVYLDRRHIRSAFCIDIADDRRVVNTS
jgi:hypothetical protein